jgi:hypothetical protein
MPETRVYLASTTVTPADSTSGCALELAKLPERAATALEGKYFAVSPKGTHVEIPKELFVALSDFLDTRKYPGAINIQFRSGQIICVEAVAKKRYR